MTKTCKKILLSVFLALLFVLCLGSFAACGGDETGDKVTYTVTVTTDATTPAKDVEVKIKGYATVKKTDENGKAEFELVPRKYTVEFVNGSLPMGYAVPNNANLKLTKDNHTCNVTLERYGYIVRLINPDGTPYYAEGVMVAVCEFDGNCKSGVPIDENGVAFLNYTDDNYHIQVLELPEGAQYDHKENNSNYYKDDFSATVRDMTIVITTTSNGGN